MSYKIKEKNICEIKSYRINKLFIIFYIIKFIIIIRKEFNNLSQLYKSFFNFFNFNINYINSINIHNKM
jgi:hypothetical protein